MRKLLSLLFTATLLMFAACEKEELTDTEYADWASRNDAAFIEKLNTAKTAINTAMQQYGNDWQAHCEWRVYRLYSYQSEEAFESADTVCVQIQERGKGLVSPLYSDSVRINYIGRLIPTGNYPEGRIFDHSGAFNNEADIFSPDFALPATFIAGNLVAGLTTALMQIHIDDKWRVFIHPKLGYAETEKTGIPAHSMLDFTIQLKGFSGSGNRAE